MLCRHILNSSGSVIHFSLALSEENWGFMDLEMQFDLMTQKGCISSQQGSVFRMLLLLALSGATKCP